MNGKTINVMFAVYLREDSVPNMSRPRAAMEGARKGGEEEAGSEGTGEGEETDEWAAAKQRGASEQQHNEASRAFFFCKSTKKKWRD